MGSKKTDISNQKFNRLTAISFCNLDRHKMTYWLFKCDCGKKVIKQKARVIAGKTSSCGCARFKTEILGQKFGKLIALKPAQSSRRYEYKWLFKCDCGNEKIISKSSVLAGRTVSCGCYGKEARGNSRGALKHGQTGTRSYHVWVGMKARCYNPKTAMFKHYGGKGIKICDRWNNSFENFLADMGEPPTSKHSINRIDNNGNYEPSNCEWATNKEQSLNRSTTKRVTFKGKTQALLKWCDELNLSYNFVRKRLSQGWTPERAFETPKFYRGERFNKL